MEKNFKKGLITRIEATRLKEDAWNKVWSELDEAVWNNMESDNSVRILVENNLTRASRDQVKQIAGMKGLSLTQPGTQWKFQVSGSGIQSAMRKKLDRLKQSNSTTNEKP